MSQSDPYFHYPLVAHALDVSPQERVQLIVASVMVEKGRALLEGLPAESGVEGLDDWREEMGETMLSEIVNGLLSKGRLPQDFDAEDDDHVAMAMMVRAHPNLQVGSFTMCWDRFAELDRFVREYEALVGGDMSVRMESDKLWAYSAGGITEREFRVLGGLYAGIGDTRYKAVSLKWWRFLSSGYKSERAYEQSRKLGQIGNLKLASPDILADYQIRYTRDKLHRLKLLSQYHTGRRTWYCIRAGQERQMMEWHTDKHARKTVTQVERLTLKAEAAEMRNAQLAQLQEIKDRLARAQLGAVNDRSGPPTAQA